jgi:hypothetical protein
VLVQHEHDRRRSGALPELAPTVDWAEQLFEPGWEIGQIASL